MPPKHLILASSSPYRQELLKRLRLPFDAISPEIDETRIGDESAPDYVKRLALEKARAIADFHTDAIVIGSDQCALLQGKILGKPGDHANALQQLRDASGKEVVFYTGLALLQPQRDMQQSDCVEFRVGFRNLSDQQIEHYLLAEQPYNCAGSFKSEGFGIALFRYLRGDDPSALIGLPLIRLTAMLEQAGIEVL